MVVVSSCVKPSLSDANQIAERIVLVRSKKAVRTDIEAARCRRRADAKLNSAGHFTDRGQLAEPIILIDRCYSIGAIALVLYSGTGFRVIDQNRRSCGCRYCGYAVKSIVLTCRGSVGRVRGRCVGLWG